MRYKLLFVFLILCTSCAIIPEKPITPGARFEAQEYVEKGAVLLQLEDLDGAKAAFEIAYDIAPIAAAVDGIGCVAFLKDEKNEARKLFLEAIRINPEYAESYGNLALLYESQGKLRQALSTYREAIEKNPKNYKIRNNFATFIAEYNIEGKDKALYELKKAESIASHAFISENIKILE